MYAYLINAMKFLKLVNKQVDYLWNRKPFFTSLYKQRILLATMSMNIRKGFALSFPTLQYAVYVCHTEQHVVALVELH